MAAAARGQVAEAADRDDVYKLLQATLIASKGGVPLDKLNREYRTLVGEPIPYRNFGFGSLQDFLDDAKVVCRVNFGPDGSAVVHGLGSEDTFHIQDMVKRQRATKKPKPKPPQRRPLNPQHQQWQPPTSADYSNQTSSGFRHGFRPVSFPAHQNGYRPQVGGNRYPPDQRNMSGSGRFQSGGRGARLPTGGFSQQASRLRTPQNGAPVSRGGFQQQQPNARPVPQRLGGGPVNGHGPAVPKPSSHQQQSYIKLLEDYFGQMGLGVPEFKTSKLEKKVSNAGKSSKKGSTTTKFYSTIRVNNQSFQTYPTEYNTEKEAEEAAAKLACDKLNLGSQNYPASQAVPPSSASSMTASSSSPADVNVDVLIDRIVELVGNRSNGVWSSQVELEYTDKYGQNLPPHWSERIETYQTRETVKKRIHIERPIQDRCIVMPYIEQPSSPTPRSPAASSSSAASSKSTSPSAPSAPLQKPRGPAPAVQPTTARSQQPRPPDLVLPEESLWDVYVTHIFSTVEVCVRLLGDDYSSKFEDLITDMELHYYDADKIPHVTQPVIGRLYAALVDGEWHRVEAVSLKGIEVTCYFIDHGGEHDVLNARVLREIEPKFLSLAPQAKRVRLAGLEEFANSPAAHNELTLAALARSLVAKVHSRKSDQDISLILFDTSADEDINVNQMLLEKLKQMPGAIVAPPPAPAATAAPATPASTPTTAEAIRTSTTSPTQEMDLLSVDLASLKPLIPAAIPEENPYFDVYVTLAASPSNFTVQPYQESAELERLSASMKEFYSDSARRHQMSPDDLLKDTFYAALHTDGLWYRVKINSQVDSCTMAVKIVDFGDFSLVPLENLQPLWPQFRNLPMQAINATLAGIVATDGDWTVDDTVWFARRVVNNAFVSVVKEVSYDKLDESIRIGVSLIDTNDPSKDVFIEKELVDSKRAAYLCI